MADIHDTSLGKDYSWHRRLDLGRLARLKAPRTASVEAQNPVADRLQIDPADPGRMGPQRPLIDRR